MTRGNALSRRRFLATSTAASMLTRPAIAQANARIVVVGGGFAGATASRELKRFEPELTVTCVTGGAQFTACPFSNLVIAGLRDMAEQTFSYDRLEARGVEVVRERAASIDVASRTVVLAGGGRLAFDRLIIAPGVQISSSGMPGYDATALTTMPHAWIAGEQTLLLRRQLEAMPDGGLVVVSVPANPYRCPPGPYERASLIAHYLKTRKPKSKLLVLDAKDQFSKQRLFQNAWRELYPDHLEWISQSAGGTVTSVEPAAMTLVTHFSRHKAAVANVIPPQSAGAIVIEAGLAEPSGWCQVDPVTFESRRANGVHILGDAIIAGAMPKSAFAANAQAKVCAAAVVELLKGRQPVTPKLINTCFSLVAPGYGISVAGVYQPQDGVLAELKGAGGTSPTDAPPAVRAMEARYAESWFKTITNETFS